jgi:serine/threonine protein kinase
MFEVGDTINGTYVVQSVCSDEGGMGQLLFVESLTEDHEFRIVLKYCRETAEEFRSRFRREVRVLAEFEGNSKVVDVLDYDLDHEPPYFVMPYYELGDLRTLIAPLEGNYELQEKMFNEMIDCVNELHSRGQFHRDLKPQNFLRSDGHIVVSDLGLSTELETATRQVTRSSQFWGTDGFLPPEFRLHGGFKHADAAGDIFMLGKTFYVLLTGRDPLYLIQEGIPEAIYAVIERSCSQDKDRRYQSVAELKQSLRSAYDILLDRIHGVGKAGELLERIQDGLETFEECDTEDVETFLNLLFMLGHDERLQLCREIEIEVATELAAGTYSERLSRFLEIYREMTEEGRFGFHFAETIASNMKALFDSDDVSNTDKVYALETAIIAAYEQNRFAAMDTCREMITNLVEPGLALRVGEMLGNYDHTFIISIEESECRSDAVGAALRGIRTDD